MATNTNPMGDAQRITVQCSCGKRLSVLPKYAGKQLKCPACGKAVIVPGSAPSLPAPRAAALIESESEGMSKNTLIALGSFVGVFALGCILFVVWIFYSSHQRTTLAANDQMQREATVILENAKTQLDVERAIELLRKSVAHGTVKVEASRLLAEAETAVSDTVTFETLTAISDEEFDRVKAGGEVRDGKVNHPALLAIRNETVQRNLNKAVQGREGERQEEEEEKRKENELISLNVAKSIWIKCEEHLDRTYRQTSRWEYQSGELRDAIESRDSPQGLRI